MLKTKGLDTLIDRQTFVTEINVYILEVRIRSAWIYLYSIGG